jgi:penicillin-binding protein 1C
VAIQAPADNHAPLIPAKAGIRNSAARKGWVPAFAGTSGPRRLALVLGLLIATLGVAKFAYDHLPLPPLAAADDLSTVVLDRDGRLLRPFATKEGRWRLPVAAEDVDPRLVAMLLAYEDKRFDSHRGVDPLALLRAAGQAIAEQKIVSGGSTLTMQVARLLEPRTERTLAAKLRQAAGALALERELPKAEILRLYFTLAPYGGNIEGVRAASLAYFGREPKRLSLGEAALLVALPQSPEARRPDRSAATARAARDRVLDRLAAAGAIDAAEAAHAKSEPVPDRRLAFPILAPHAAAEAVADAPAERVHRLSIGRDAQAALELLARDRALGMGEKISVAILVADPRSGEVLAHVGSADHLDARRAGFVDMTAAIRSPGSTLKPFIYGLALDQGLVHPETLIHDRPTRFGLYAPENFDETYQGTITVRRALQQSLNVPAVTLLSAVTPQRLDARLRAVGTELKLPPGEPPALPIALGGVGVTLRGLVSAYGAFVNGGTVAPLAWRPLGPDAPVLHHRRLLDPVAAWQVADILAGTPPPEAGSTERIAFKTGTSYGYRDAWAIGFDGQRIVGVWVGRPDGAASAGLSGRTSAAPILFDAFARLGGGKPLPPAPPGVLVATTAKLPPPLRLFAPGEAKVASAPQPTAPLAIAFPPDGARIDLGGAGTKTPLALKAAGGALPLTWLVNGTPVFALPHRRDASWLPDGPGFSRVSVIDANGRSASALVRID